MNYFTLLRRSLAFYWRTNLAIVLGVMIATAVLSGALVVGDSVRDSLKQMSLDRLGRIDHVLSSTRFFREALADDLSAQLSQDSAEFGASMHVAPLISLLGTLEARHLMMDQAPVHSPRISPGDATDPRIRVVRAGHVQVYGADGRAWALLNPAGIAPPGPGEVVLARRVADQLNVQPGSPVSLIIEIPASIPRDALLGDREETVTELSLTVSAVAEDLTGIARLGFNPTQQLPLNAFVNLGSLQEQAGLAAVVRSRSQPIAKPARVNTVLISTGGTPSYLTPKIAERLTQELSRVVTLEDLALRLVINSERGYVSLESEQMFLEQGLSEPALKSAGELDYVVSPVQVYLLNEMWNVNDPGKYSMYSVIAGVDPTGGPPFGPFLSTSGQPIKVLPAGEVLINEWLAADLGVQAGDQVGVKYHVVGDRGELPEAEAKFRIAGVVSLQGAANDRGFTPNVPGVTDADSYAEWREPFPLKRTRITSRDDEYWEEYRTTPKLVVNLETAQKLWRSRYGDLTSTRLAPRQGQSLDQLVKEFTTQYLSTLNPQQSRLEFQPVKFQGLQAAAGTTDFTGLFMGFSFFLIAAAVMLNALLFRLAVEMRGREFGVLAAVGFGSRRSRGIALSEGWLLSLLGGVLGVCAGVGYAGIMIHGLKTWWNGAIGTRFLFLSVHPVTLVIGFVISVIVSVGAVWWGVRQLSRISTRDQLQGATTPESSSTDKNTNSRSRRWAIGLTGTSLTILVFTLMGIIPEQEAFFGFSWRVVVFFGVGIGLLTGGLSVLGAVLSTDAQGQQLAVTGGGLVSRMRLALRSASRCRTRSILTTSLIAWATFVLTAVGAARMNPASLEPNPRSGNGGFTLVAETNVPLLFSLNTAEGRAKLGFDPTNQREEDLISAANVLSFRVKSGENASCLNVYRTQLPTILGVPDDVLQEMVVGRRFLFANTPQDHPWELLTTPLASGRIPVLGDMNTLMYSLHKGPGTTIDVPPIDGPGGTLQVAGMFSGSVFQGVLVMSASNFQKLFPNVYGYNYFLIEVAPEQAGELSDLLESRLGDYGFDAERVSDRISDFLAVQNTYLSTFQTLGGLGMLLGTAGLAVVMLRNVVERRGELALLRAVGFPPSDVGILVLLENGLLMVWGLGCGGISALLAMMPHISGAGADVPWGSLAALFTGVFLFGMLAALWAVREAVTTPILSTLRGE